MDLEDRGKTSITLTSRGRAAAAVQAATRERIDTELTECVGAECVAQMRKALGALCAMGCNENSDD